MKKQRKLFLSGFNREAPVLMHCVSRVVDRQYLFGDEEREVFVQMMRMYEEFCGVRVLSYCVMSNHFHILLEIPPHFEEEEISDATLLEKLSAIYSDGYVKEVKRLIRKLNKNQATKAMRELKKKYTYRMGDMSEFMKSLKQRFTQWFNKKHGRRGTLWEERYSATGVSAGSAARMVAAYIDLNPLRAGLLGGGTSTGSSAGDPKDYRWSSYGAAMGGDSQARAGYEHLMRMVDREGAATLKLRGEEAMSAYRMVLADEGEAAEQDGLPVQQGESASKRRKRKCGYSRAEIEQILEREGKLSMAEILRCRTRYFTEGLVLGSKRYVADFCDRVAKQVVEQGGVERKGRGTPLRKLRKLQNLQGSKGGAKVASGKMYSYRDLQKTVYGE